MVGIGLGSAVGGYIGKELIADKKDSRDSRVYAAIGGVIGGLIGGFAPELKASIGDGLRNLANLGKVFSDAGEVIGDVGELYASTRSGVAFFESVGESDHRPNEANDPGDDPPWWNILSKIGDPYALPDAISFSGNVDVVVAGGTDISPSDFNKLFILKGKSAGQSVSYTDLSISSGYDVGASAVMTKFYYTGDVSTLTLSDFDGFRFTGSMGVSVVIEVGGGISVAPVIHGGYIIGISTHIGVSPPGISGNAGSGWTRLKKEEINHDSI